MSLDYNVLLYNPVYAQIGVPATFAGIDITVIDDTRPKTQASGSAEVRSVGPGAFARIPELVGKGIVRGDYIDAILIFNGRNWVVRSYEVRGSPNGEDLGEVRFLLKEAMAIVPPIDTTAPTITSAAAVNNVEGTALAHNLTADESVTWSKIGGADAAHFTLAADVLRWTSGIKDHEDPHGPSYIVQVRATDAAGNTTDQTITVTVTNIADEPPVNVTAPIVSGTPIVSETLTCTSTVDDWTGTSPIILSWQWYRKEMPMLLTDDAGNILVDEFGQELTT